MDQLEFDIVAPTVRDHVGFKPEDDIPELRKALTASPIDEKVLIQIICNRSNAQRQVLRAKYKAEFQIDLIDDVKAKLTGGLKKVLVSLLHTPMGFYTLELRDAITKKNPDAFVELLCAINPSNVQKIKKYYEKTYSTTLLRDVERAFKNAFGFFAKGIISDKRKDGFHTDLEEAQALADRVNEMRELDLPDKDVEFATIVTEANLRQINLIAREYETKTGRTLLNDVEIYFSKFLKEPFMAMIEMSRGRDKFFAGRLRRSMNGLGINEGEMIRIFVMRAEIDLYNIKTEFFSEDGSLEDWITEEASGDYSQALLTLLEEEL